MSLPKKNLAFKYDRGLVQQDVKDLRKASRSPLSLTEMAMIDQKRDYFESAFIKKILSKGAMNPDECVGDLKGKFSVFFKTLLHSFDKESCMDYIKKHEDGVERAFRGYFYYRISIGIAEAFKKREEKEVDPNLSEEEAVDYIRGLNTENLTPNEIHEFTGDINLTQYIYARYVYGMRASFLKDICGGISHNEYISDMVSRIRNESRS